MPQKFTLKISLVLLGGLIFNGAFAQQNFSLKQCIEYSLAHHPSVQMYKNETRITHQRFVEGLSGYMPQINANATFDDNIKRQTTIIPAGPISPTPIEVQFGNQYQTNLMIQYDQVIYDQSMITGLQSFTPAKELTQAQVDKNNQTLIYNTASAYYQVLIIKQELALLTENEKKFTELQRIQQLQYDKGVIQKVDLDRVKVTLSTITANKSVSEANLQLAMNQLKNSMGLSMQENIVVTDSVDNKIPKSMTPASQFSLQSLPDYVMQDRNIKVQDFDYKRKIGTFIPTLSFYARYGAQSFSNDIGTAFSNWYDYAAIGLKLNIPIFDGMRKASQMQQSKLSMLNMKENMKIISNNLEVQYQNANTQLLSAYSTLQSNEDNLNLARDVYNTTDVQYKNGAATLSDLLNADYAYKEASKTYVNSLLRYLIARLDLERSQGTIQQNIDNL